MKKIFLIWSDLDYVRVEEFNIFPEAEARIDALTAKYATRDYGFTILKVISGVALKMESIEVTTKCKLSS
jgi:hypothetical protein